MNPFNPAILSKNPFSGSVAQKLLEKGIDDTQCANFLAIL